MNASAFPQRLRWHTLERALPLERGEALPGVQIAYRTWGQLSTAADNAVVVCHALTGSADADIWWGEMFGPGRALDPERYFIVCSNVLGGCHGTTGANSLGPDGMPWGNRFPRVTIRDQVRLQMALADALGIRQVRCVIGGSMGGLQALEWALLDPDRVQSVVSIAASSRQSSWGMAWNEVQRMAILADPLFQAGRYTREQPPLAGLSAARAAAMISYRSPESLGKRFSAPDAWADEGEAVRGWLHHHGTALGRRFDTNCYLTLLSALDSHDLARGRGRDTEVLAGVKQPVLVGSITTDALYVPAEQRDLVRALPRAELFEIDSRHGHDGFLIDVPLIEPAVRRFLDALPASAALPEDRVKTAPGDPQAHSRIPGTSRAASNLMAARGITI